MTDMTQTAANDRLGEVTGPREITFVRLLPGPIDRAWAFLVEADKRRLWLAGGEIEPRLGGKVTLVFHNAQLTADGETVPERFAGRSGCLEDSGRVTAWAPPHRLAFSWGGEPGETSEVVFDLAEAGDGKVRLTLTHRALKDRAGMLGVSGGWHAHLGLLVAALEGRKPDRFWSVIEAAETTYGPLLPNA
jgi:uncharacterized protein YndB with AHSA1/START domain